MYGKPYPVQPMRARGVWQQAFEIDDYRTVSVYKSRLIDMLHNTAHKRADNI